MTLADRVERVLRCAAPSLRGMRDRDIEDWICEDLGVEPRKFLHRSQGCGCRSSRARGFEGWSLCAVYAIPEIRIPDDWIGGWTRPGSAALRAWRQEELSVSD